jgi:hypothetical protein
MRKFIRRIWNILRSKIDALLGSLENPDEQLSVFLSEILHRAVRGLKDMSILVDVLRGHEKSLHADREAA